MQNGIKRILITPVYILIFIIIGLSSGYLTFKVLSFSRTVEVPDLRGKNLVEANEIMGKIGLYLKVEGEDYDPFIATGYIVRQDIPYGNKVKEQRGIKVVLSKGPKVFLIPDLAGQSIEDAEMAAARSGLKINKIIRVHSKTIEKGRIIAQRPNPDETMKEGLFLVVSAGPYDIIYYCPDFSGKSMDDALDIAEKLGIKVEFTGSGEKVKTQKPKPNSLIKTGDTLYLHLEGDADTHG